MVVSISFYELQMNEDEAQQLASESPEQIKCRVVKQTIY